jgi:hypothetical protein
MELLQDARDVRFRCRLADHEPFADLRVGEAAREQVEDFLLARRQLLELRRQCRNRRGRRRIFFALVAVAVTAMVAVGTSSAAREPMTFMCGGQELTFTVTIVKNDQGLAWGVGTISGGSHLIPTSFSGTFTDVTTNTVLFSFSQMKGNGNALKNQMQITCTQTESGTAADLGVPDVAPTDMLEFNFTVTAVLKP